jgi:uncharacterized membrane protein YphA (DoxX/SURF4 family)
MSGRTVTAWVDRLWSHRAHNAIAIPLRVWVGIVFIAAAWHKIVFPAKFALSIATYQILPLQYINLMAIILPWLEIVVGVTLMLGLWTRASALIMVGMNVMFIAALYLAIQNQTQMTSCGCFSADAEATKKTIGWDYVYRDVNYLAAMVYVALFDDGWLGLDGLIRHLRQKLRQKAAE